MQTIHEMISILRNNPAVLGLIEFGSDHCVDNYTIGDYDLFVILSGASLSVRSLHFNVGNTPVDLNIRTLSEIQNLNPVGAIDSVLLDGRVIFDPTGQVSREISALRQKWQQLLHEGLSEHEVARFRHRHKHFFDTLRGRLKSAPTLCRFALTANLFWLMRDYFQIRGLDFTGTAPGETRTFEYISQHEPEIYKAIQDFYATLDLEQQFRISLYITELVLKPIGGMPRPDEVLTLGNNQDIGLAQLGYEVFRTLFA